MDGRLTTNPTYSEIKNSLLNLVVAGTEDAIVMVEAGAKEVSEAAMIEAIEYAHGEIRRIVAAQKELFELLGLKKREFTAPARDEALYEEVRRKIEPRSARGDGHLKVRQARKPSQNCRAAQSAGGRLSRGRCRPKRKLVAHFVDEVEERLFRDDVLQKRQRPDRRAFDQVRADHFGSWTAAAYARFGPVHAR